MPTFKEKLEELRRKVNWEYLRNHKTVKIIVAHYKTFSRDPLDLETKKAIFRELVYELNRLLTELKNLDEYLKFLRAGPRGKTFRETFEIRKRVLNDIREFNINIKSLENEIGEEEAKQFFKVFNATYPHEIPKFFEQPIVNDEIAEKVLKAIKIFRNREKWPQAVKEKFSRTVPNPVSKIERAIERALINLQTYRMLKEETNSSEI